MDAAISRLNRLPHCGGAPGTNGEHKANMLPCPCMEEGRKRVLAIVAGILVARHLKTTDDLFNSRSSPRTESSPLRFSGRSG